MKRENIPLIALARRDNGARCELGRRYLRGSHGLPRHEQLGLEYLEHPSVRHSAAVARILSEELALERIASLGYQQHLQRAATDGSAEAQFKLGVWQTVCDEPATARQWIAAAADQGHAGAAAVRAALTEGSGSDQKGSLLRALRAASDVPIADVALAAADRAVAQGDLAQLARCTQLALADRKTPAMRCAPYAKAAVLLAAKADADLSPLTAGEIESCLDALAADGDIEAAYLLGCAYCGIDSPGISYRQVVVDTNLRKGSALLLRAADAGLSDAWMHLFEVHSDHRCSVANPQLARFFLEKAASVGHIEAQRRLGALVLRSATELKASESGIYWLHTAASSGDQAAGRLLETLVLPLQGGDDEASRAIATIHMADPWLAARMRLSRDFGLTKLEALCVDVVAGRRPWGIVVGQNPFVVLSKLAAPRAVPALSKEVLNRLARIAALFEGASRDGDLLEGDYRRRSARQRELFRKHDIDEALFFASATSMKLESLRKGTKWALRVRGPLQAALAAANSPSLVPA